MKLVFDREAWPEYVSWQMQDTRIVERINLLIGDCMRHPFTGVGKPEPLKRNFAGWWSRRINYKHRLVYRVRGADEAQALEILSCRMQY